MRINNNLMAMNTHRQLGINNNQTGKSVEKLSSGLRINRAGDDAAGLAISEKMRNQIKGLNQASRNSQDGISLIQTAEGALNETHSMLKRVRELAVQSNNDTNTSEDLGQIQEEIDSLVSEIDKVAGKTTFNTKNLLDGSLGVKVATGSDYQNYDNAGIEVNVNGISASATISVAVGTGGVTVNVDGVTQTLSPGVNPANTTVSSGTVLDFDAVGVKLSFTADADISTAADFDEIKTDTDPAAEFQIGANEDTTLAISVDDMSSSALGADGNIGIDNIDVKNETFKDNLNSIDEAIEDVSTQRSKLGAWQNRLEHTIKNLDTSSENLQAAESRIRDVDMAAEMMKFTKNNILKQASQSMLAQANQQPQGVLQLLR